MSSNVVELSAVRKARETREARISVSLRNLSRACRKEILVSGGYQSLRGGMVTAEQYERMLEMHYGIRAHLEKLLESVGGTFSVSNAATNERKQFELRSFGVHELNRSADLATDLYELSGRR